MRDALLRAITRSVVVVLGQRHGETAARIILARLPRRLRPVRGPRGTVQALGVRWTLDTHDNLQRVLYYAGSYEMASIEEARARVPRNGVVLDVGANIGTFTLPLAFHVTEGSVIAVEPSPAALRRLTEHTASSRPAHRVTIVPSALGREPGELTLHPSSRQGAQDIGTWSAYGEESTGITVEVRRGDDLLESLGIDRLDLIKIDVEGMEVDVLAGLRQSLVRHRPAVICEVVPRLQERAGHAGDEVTEFLTALGYAPFAIRTRGLVPLPDGWSGNVLFVPPTSGQQRTG